MRKRTLGAPASPWLGLVAWWLGASGAGCPAAPPPVPPSVGPTQLPAGDGGAAGPEAAPGPTAPGEEALDEEILLVVGGNFAPDHLGPERYASIVERVRTHAAACLTRFDERFLRGAAPDPDQLELHLPTLLGLAAAGDPAGALALARRLRSAYPLALEMARDAGQRERLRQRLLTLDVLLTRLEPEPDRFTQQTEPDRACAARDDDGRSVLRVERDCSCGEQLACRAELRDETLDLDVRLDDSIVQCRDCYQTIAICLLPELPAATTLDVTLAGRS
ncbi:MAG: hypothetical protein JXB32_06465, partial [Deltaproteobacteria bacterium]|nr:hypothetical protein [Deltaproteobacteria bacterium]